MLRAGLTPDRAFEEIARRRGPGGVTDQVWHSRTQGRSLMEAITEALRDQSPAWRAFGAAWEIARVSGAPVGPALESLSRGLRDQERTSRLIDAELAAPHATMRLVGLLPLVAVLGGALGGVNSLNFLFLTTPGRGALLVGVGFLTLAWWWMRVMVRRVVQERKPPSPRHDLFLVALGGGVPPRTAVETVDGVMRKWDLETPVENDLEGLVNL
ncbi:MAG: type II secretion system F family protein, partial [Pontimonas sp.]